MKISDSLSIKLNENENLTFRDLVKLKTSTPVAKINKDKIQLKKRIVYQFLLKLYLIFIMKISFLILPKKKMKNYNIKLLPGAIEDIYGNKMTV